MMGAVSFLTKNMLYGWVNDPMDEPFVAWIGDGGRQ
jgi:hypothetical protein